MEAAGVGARRSVEGRRLGEISSTAEPSEGTGEGKGEAIFPRKRLRADRAWEYREISRP